VGETLTRTADPSVVSYYNEPLDSLRETVHEARTRLGKGSKRVIIYLKGDKQQIPELLKVADEVVPLENLGREGGTYLVGGLSELADSSRTLSVTTPVDRSISPVTRYFSSLILPGIG
jgi:hypothetical protein